MRKLRDFFLYNNTLPIMFVFLTISGGTVLAANEDIRESVTESVIARDVSIVSVDNSFITSVDLESYNPTIEITDITEDDTSYIVSYVLETIEVSEGVWQEVSKEETLQVFKAQLGERDLGLYLAEEFSELVASIKQQLLEVQVVERELGKQKKIVRTDYSGLIGRFLDATEAEFDGYDPVIEAEVIVQQQPKTIAIRDLDTEEKEVSDDEKEESNSSGQSDQNQSTQNEESEDISTSTQEVGTSTEDVAPEDVTSTSTASSTVVTDVDAPVLDLNGPDSVTLEYDELYEDLGATAVDDLDGDVTSQIVVTGEVGQSAGVYTITYTVADNAGNQSQIQREVTRLEKVVDAEDESEDPAPDTSSTTEDSL